MTIIEVSFLNAKIKRRQEKQKDKNTQGHFYTIRSFGQ
jgi:hypothetical protein